MNSSYEYLLIENNMDGESNYYVFCGWWRWLFIDDIEDDYENNFRDEGIVNIVDKYVRICFFVFYLLFNICYWIIFLLLW